MNASLRSGGVDDVEGERLTFSAITTAPRMDGMTTDLEYKAYFQALYPALGISTPREEWIRWINITRLGEPRWLHGSRPKGCFVDRTNFAGRTGQGTTQQ